MLYLKIKNRDKSLFEGEVENISSYNKVGLFNILIDHSNFISIIEKQILIKQNGQEINFPLDNALLKVQGNKVNIYIGVK